MKNRESATYLSTDWLDADNNLRKLTNFLNVGFGFSVCGFLSVRISSLEFRHDGGAFRDRDNWVSALEAQIGGIVRGGVCFRESDARYRSVVVVCCWSRANSASFVLDASAIVLAVGWVGSRGDCVVGRPSLSPSAGCVFASDLDPPDCRYSRGRDLLVAPVQ